jgi:hypothetical protein
MQNPSEIAVFFTGVVGAIAPEILRLYNARNTLQLSWSPAFLIASSIFALLGGFLAYIMPATTLWGAFYIGVSTPVVVNTALRQTNRELREPAGNTAAGARVLGAKWTSRWTHFVRAL